jgi:hypothetical protein
MTLIDYRSNYCRVIGIATSLHLLFVSLRCRLRFLLVFWFRYAIKVNLVIIILACDVRHSSS